MEGHDQWRLEQYEREQQRRAEVRRLYRQARAYRARAWWLFFAGMFTGAVLMVVLAYLIG